MFPNIWDWRNDVGEVLSTARRDCMMVHESEKLLGYDESAQLYLEIANELGAVSVWLYQVFR
jgi:hypothetical protein